MTVRYDISCGGCPLRSFLQVEACVRRESTRRTKDSDYARGRRPRTEVEREANDVSGPEAERFADMDRRKGGASQEALGRRPVRKSDCGRARRHHPQCGDRQGAQPRAFGTCQGALLVDAAAAQAASCYADV